MGEKGNDLCLKREVLAVATGFARRNPPLSPRSVVPTNATWALVVVAASMLGVLFYGSYRVGV